MIRNTYITQQNKYELSEEQSLIKTKRTFNFEKHFINVVEKTKAGSALKNLGCSIKTSEITRIIVLV